MASRSLTEAQCELVSSLFEPALRMARAYAARRGLGRYLEDIEGEALLELCDASSRADVGLESSRGYVLLRIRNALYAWSRMEMRESHFSYDECRGYCYEANGDGCYIELKESPRVGFLMDLMTEKQREVVELRTRGWLFSEIGGVIGVTKEAASGVYERGINRVKRLSGGEVMD